VSPPPPSDKEKYVAFLKFFQHIVISLCHKQDSLKHGMAAFVDGGRQLMHTCYKLYSTMAVLITRDTILCI